MITEQLFECPSCGSHRLEEVQTGVTVSSPITEISEGGDIDYGEQYQDDGEVARYQCLDCGWILKKPSGEKINQCDELWDYLNDPDRECKPGNFAQMSNHKQFVKAKYPQAHAQNVDDEVQVWVQVRTEEQLIGYGPTLAAAWASARQYVEDE